MGQLPRIALIIATLLIALGVGFLLRRRLIRRLKNTVLDNWVAQTLGVIVIIIPFIIGLFLVPFIYDWSISTFPTWWKNITGQELKVQDVISVATHLIETLLLIGLGIGVARTVRNLTVHNLSENRIDINMRTLIGRIFYFIVLIFAAFWVLAVWQISITVPVATLGILSVLVTVAIQDILKDLVAGFYILLERPFYIGDQVTISTYTGKVEDVQIRATKLRLVSGEEVTIPNAMVFGGIVVNNTYYGERRAIITIKLPQEEAQQGEISAKILTTLKDFEAIVEKPEPTVMFSTYAEQKITYTLRFWVIRGQYATISDVMFALHTLLPNAELAVQESAGNV